MYRGDDNAPPGPDQDQVPAAELQPGRGRAVHRGQGLRQEDVRPGDKIQRRRRVVINVMSCVQEGLFSFWKGLLPPILVETPKRAWKFFTFEQFQKVFLFGSDKPSALVRIA